MIVNDFEMIRKATEIAVQYYSGKKLSHAIRVANYAQEIAEKDKMAETYHYQNGEAYVVGLLHDLIEDTKFPAVEMDKMFPSHIGKAVDVLTKRDNEDYDTYIDRVISSKNHLAFLVKKADMKDHLAQTDTLTDKLKEKYFPHIAKFI